MNTREARKQFIVMICVQIIMTAFISIQWIVVYIYYTFTRNEIRTADQSAIVRFVFTLSNYFFYLNYVKSFYISMLTSKLFRKTLMTGILNFLPHRMHHRFEMTVTTVRPRGTILQ
jgi:ABC-type thiamin/hydroxymethylpyrimidine transport system permease subunit